MLENSDSPLVFISYRRADTEPVADRLFSDLQRQLEIGTVFLDRHGIDGGEEWAEKISEGLTEASAVIVLIGPKWLTEQNRFGQQRLSLDDDWVHKEITVALNRRKQSGLLVLPVLVDGREPLPADALNHIEAIKDLPTIQGWRLRIGDWNTDLNRILKKLESVDFRIKRNVASEDEAAGPSLGSLVAKCCNRSRQHSQFYEFLVALEKAAAKGPRVCVVRGVDGECHGWLVERFCRIHIRDYAEKIYQQKDAVVEFKDIRDILPAGSVETRTNHLIEKFYRLFLSIDVPIPRRIDSENAAALLSARKEKILVIQHDLPLRRFGPDTFELLARYLEFWNKVCREEIPEVFLFFNIRYGSGPGHLLPVIKHLRIPLDYIFKWRVETSLKKHLAVSMKEGDFKTRTNSVFGIVLDELNDIGTDHVLQWFTKYRVFENETREKKLARIAEMFRDPNGKIRGSRSMGDIGPLLAKTVAQLQPRIDEI